MELQQVERRAAQHRFDEGRLGVDEQADALDEGRQRTHQRGGSLDCHVARALFVEHETQRIRPGVAGGMQVLQPGDAADFYANSHRSELSGRAKCAGYRMWVRYSPAASKVGAARVRSRLCRISCSHSGGWAPAPTWIRQPIRLRTIWCKKPSAWKSHSR